MKPFHQPVRIFENDLLEALSRNGPLVIAMVWGTVAAVAFAVAATTAVGPALALTACIGTVVFWSLFEYVMHRFCFHAPFRGAWGQRFTFVIHGNHHVDPMDAMRNVMPLSVTIPAGLVLFAIDRALFPLGMAAWIAGSFALSYLVYDLLHWGTHQRRPRTRLGRFLRRTHMRHHFLSEQRNFGVTSPVWDLVFGTYASPKTAASRETLKA